MSVLSRLFGGGEPHPPAPLPYRPDSPEGLAARWVQWAASTGRAGHPIDDRTGEKASVNQPDDVWFLAGTFGQRVQRRCTMPLGRPVFFPVFNMWHVGALDGPPPEMPHAVAKLVIDGEPVEADRIVTPSPFEVVGARGNPVTHGRKPVAATVWGLWKRLDPLSEGRHRIEFAGGDGHGFVVAATYFLTVG